MLNPNQSEKNSNPSNQFNIFLEGYEGPIDLLLELARKQKVDLSNISILDLAEQYLNFIQKFREQHLEIAADYLVMATWLTYLKSRLLLPKETNDEEHTPEELEASLKYQLQRLEAMQNTSKILYSRSIIDRDIFYRGSSEGIKVIFDISYSSSLYDLLKTYSFFLVKNNQGSLTISASELYSVDSAIQRLKNMLGLIIDWTNFKNLFPVMGKNIVINKSSVSSNFVASLELVKNGFIELKQKETFGNIYIRAKN